MKAITLLEVIITLAIMCRNNYISYNTNNISTCCINVIIMFVNIGTTVGGDCCTLLNVLFPLMNDGITLVKALIMFIHILFTTLI